MVGHIIPTQRTRRHLAGYQVQPSELAGFLQQLPSLQTLSVSSGASLTGHVRDAICNHCFGLEQLTIHSWYGEPPRNADADSEKFLNGLTLWSVSKCPAIPHPGPRMIRALSSHWNSRRELKLAYLETTTQYRRQIFPRRHMVCIPLSP